MKQPPLISFLLPTWSIITTKSAVSFRFYFFAVSFVRNSQHLRCWRLLPTLLNSNSIWKQWMKSHLVEMPLRIRHYYYYYYWQDFFQPFLENTFGAVKTIISNISRGLLPFITRMPQQLRILRSIQPQRIVLSSLSELEQLVISVNSYS